MVTGVIAVVSGYAGGQVANPSYTQVCSGSTGHAEVVQISFDPSVITLAEVLDIFWAIHDPTTPNRQGADVGSQYRSIILYASETQHATALESIRQAQELWPQPIVTELAPLEAFYPAEAEHQDFYAKNPGSRYCQIVINPKLAKLRQSYAAKLKPDA
jgi:peptide-methionine (S)-S-oxide reductase